jgi:hypothetical protein
MVWWDFWWLAVGLVLAGDQFFSFLLSGDISGSKDSLYRLVCVIALYNYYAYVPVTFISAKQD